MREIGSEFWDIPLVNNEKPFGLVPDIAQWYLSGRSALNAIIEELPSVNSVALPSWCCDSIIKPFLNYGIKVSFYPVYWDGGIAIDINYDCDVILIMDYFGYSISRLKLNNYKGIIIRDVTHSLFSKKYSDADYYFGSLRKWCGFWTGGYAWKEDGSKFDECELYSDEYVFLRKEAMRLKQLYINDSLSNDKGYLDLFEKAESILENVEIEAADQRDVKLAKRIDVNRIFSQRNKNADILRKEFSEWLIFPEINKNDCPMFVPIIVPDGNRDILRASLIDNSIYCPVHWPISNYHDLDNKTEFIYHNELSLVCDQRYNENDMDKIIEIIKKFNKEK